MLKLRPIPVLSCALAVLILAGSLVLGCRGTALPTQANQQAIANRTAIVTSQREQLEQIPPPTKAKFMTIHTFESWENPFLTVQSGMLQLHVTVADANPSTYGAGGLLRPIGARRQVVNITPEQLGEAMTSIPQTAWPYGRVIAIEEAHKTPASAEPAVRRTLEGTITSLTDLGIAVYDPNEGKLE